MAPISNNIRHKNIIFTSDLSKLTETEKSERYLNLCQGFNLDPNTYPFKLLRVNGKEVLACRADFAQYLISRYYKLSKAEAVPNPSPTKKNLQ